MRNGRIQYRGPRVLLGASLLWAGLTNGGKASGILWSLPFFQDHRLSSGGVLPGTVRFQLGVFQNGFVPAVGNRSEWRQHWKARAEVTYSASFKGFSAELPISSNPPPFLGSKFYVWGFLPTGPASSDWILLGDPAWVMPEANELEPSRPVDMASAREVLVGQLQSETGAVALEGVPIGESPRLLFPEWLAQHFTPTESMDPGVGGRDADPDGDGRSNALEYSQGTLPQTPDQNSPLQITLQAGGLVEVSSAWSSSADFDFTLQTALAPHGPWQTEPQSSRNDAVAGFRAWSFPPSGRNFWRLSRRP